MKMNKKYKLYLALMLLIVIGIGGGLTFAQPTDSNTIYLPNVHKPLVVRVDDAYEFYAKYNSYIVGKVTNVSNQTVYDVNLTASLFLNNELVDVITGTTGLPATFPSDSNLFRFSSNYVDDMSLEVNVESWSFEHDPEYLPLTVLSKNFSGGFEQGYLTGEIRNDNPAAVNSIEMMTYPDSEFFSHATPDKKSLAPGETTTYTIWLYFPSALDGEDYTVWAQGVVDK
jgi:hypothetical protein